MASKFNKSAIMKAAWAAYFDAKYTNLAELDTATKRKRFSNCLRNAWAQAKMKISRAADPLADIDRRIDYLDRKARWDRVDHQAYDRLHAERRKLAAA